MKNIKRFTPLLLGCLSVFGFAATDYNLFGLFGGFGWGPVIFSIVNYLIFILFLLGMAYHLCVWIYNRKINFSIAFQYMVSFILFFGMIVWMEYREPFPNSSYSEEFYK